jgi:hypothetical protein
VKPVDYRACDLHSGGYYYLALEVFYRVILGVCVIQRAVTT